jgi:hypothetical protein
MWSCPDCRSDYYLEIEDRKRQKRYPENLYVAVFGENGYESVPSDYDVAINWVLDSLNNSREKEIVLQYFKYRNTCKVIGRLPSVNLSTSRTTEIKNEVISKLKHPSREVVLIHGVAELQKRAKDKEEKTIKKQAVSLSDVMLEDLGLSLRVFNSLKRIGVVTLLDLSKVTLKTLSELNSLKESHIVEIAETCLGWGIVLSEE